MWRMKSLGALCSSELAFRNAPTSYGDGEVEVVVTLGLAKTSVRV